MLKNYIKVALRNLIHNKFIASLNILGLAVGMSTSIILLLFIHLELSYDRFHKNFDEIFRIIENAETSDGQTLTIPSTLGYISPAINEEFYPEIKACRIYNREINNRFGFREIQHVRFYYVDSTFFEIFSFPFLYGSSENALTESNTVVLTEHIAKAYFSQENPIGELFEIHGKNYVITAILRDIPINSHLQFDLLLPFAANPRINILKQMPMDFPTYLRIDKKVLNEGKQEAAIEITGRIVNDHYKPSGVYVNTGLQSLKDVHLRSNNFDTALHQTGDHATVVILSFLSLFILLITISNFINLITSRTENRLREIGMRLVTGATKRDVLKQLIAESLLIAILACFFALAFTELLSGPFSNIVGVKIKISILDFVNLFILFLIIAGITGVLSGAVHYIYLSGFSPIQVLSVIRFRSEISWLKIGLVIIQFSMMIFLLAVFSVLYFQVRYMSRKNPGFNIDEMVVFYEPFRQIAKDFEPVRSDLLRNNWIMDAAASEGIPGVVTSVQNIWVEGDTIMNSRLINEHRVKDHYVSTYGLEIIEGDDLSTIKDTAGFLLNETAVKMLDLNNPVGTVVNVDISKFPVLGVVKDFQYQSLHNPVEPLVISTYFSLYKYITLRVNPDSIQSAISYADSIIRIHYPDGNFTHFLLSERYKSMYDDEQKTSRLLSWGAILAILISMLGLFGLSSQTVIKRTKEIGIRKANGGNSWDIMVMLIANLLRWILVSLIISMPLAILITNKWMDRFAYKITHFQLLLVLSGVLALLIALLTVSYHTYSIGKKNPVHSLRYE
ncbi:MAG: hypothetical protein AMS27_11145 [Bacteroides sp. SM23_62_1]|nr:MAG: hypothetical protein AMS27_11145 [Bacteroides sp. SM23_62_1]